MLVVVVFLWGFYLVGGGGAYFVSFAAVNKFFYVTFATNLAAISEFSVRFSVVDRFSPLGRMAVRGYLFP